MKFKLEITWICTYTKDTMLSDRSLKKYDCDWLVTMIDPCDAKHYHFTLNIVQVLCMLCILCCVSDGESEACGWLHMTSPVGACHTWLGLLLQWWIMLCLCPWMRWSTVAAVVESLYRGCWKKFPSWRRECGCTFYTSYPTTMVINYIPFTAVHFTALWGGKNNHATQCTLNGKISLHHLFSKVTAEPNFGLGWQP